MNNVEKIEQATKEISNAATSSVHTFETSIQAIAAAHTDYAKKAMHDGSEFFSKLTSVKDPVNMIELQREYVKNAYETFVADVKKITALYTDLFKHTTKPLQDLIEKNKAA